MTAFEEMGVLPEIAKAIDEIDWTLPTDVQAEAIPLILGGGDVLMAAETGSGKTGAFCIPILQIVWESVKDQQSGKNRSSSAAKSLDGLSWGLSLFNRDKDMVVTPDGLRCQSRDQKKWQGCRANKGIKGDGKYYFETIIAAEGLCRVGWATAQAYLDLGTDSFGYGFGGTGKKSNSRQFDSYGEPFGMHDVIGCLLDLRNGEIRFMKNGIDLGVAFVLNGQQRAQTFYPAVVVKNSEIHFNFGAQPFKHPPPSGYVAISTSPKENIVENPANGGNNRPDVKPANNAPQAIVIEPSRELAEQTYNQLQKFNVHLKNPSINDLLVIGGVSVKEQCAVLNTGVNIIVATPGRLEDLIKGGYVSLANCRFFVLDEADALLKQGYTKFIENLHQQMPKVTSDGNRLQMIVCSATLHAFEVKQMAERLMHFPTWVDLKGEDAVPETVHHVVVTVDPQTDKSWWNLKSHIPTDGVHIRDNVKPGSNNAETLSEATKILKGEYCIRAIREHKMDRAIIFCRTKIDCDNLERYLKQVGGNEFSCVCLHGDRKPQERKANLDRFKAQEVKFLICTDVAARGLDITGLPFMINITLPDEKSNYVHRIGRVGRVDCMGLAISLVSNVPEKVWYHGNWCTSRGRECNNTNLTDVRGCCVWYNEQNYLAEIEDHLNVTIQQIGTDIKVPMDKFDGKVTYGQKRVATGSNYQDHVKEMAPIVKDLAKLESEAQLAYLKRYLVAH